MHVYRRKICGYLSAAIKKGADAFSWLSDVRLARDCLLSDDRY